MKNFISGIANLRLRFYKPALTFKINQSRLVYSIIFVLVFGVIFLAVNPGILKKKTTKIEGFPSKQTDIVQQLPKNQSEEPVSPLTDVSVSGQGNNDTTNVVFDTSSFVSALLDAGMPPRVADKESKDHILQSQYFQTATEFFLNKKWDEAKEFYLKTIEVSSAASDYTKQSYLKLAELNGIIENFPNSLNYYNYFLKEFGSDYAKLPVVYLNLGIIYCKMNDIDNSKKYVQMALAKNPALAEAYIAQANINLFNKEYEKAFFTYKKALSVVPRNPEINFNLGYLLYKYDLKSTGESAKIKQYFDAAINNAYPAVPAQQKILHQAAAYNYSLYMKDRDFVRAEQYLNKLPDSLYRSKQLAEIMFLTGRNIYDIEYIYTDSIFKEEPRNPLNYISLADKFYSLINYDKALYYYTKALRLNNRTPKTYFGIGRCEFQKGNLELAYNAFAKMEAVVGRQESTLIDQPDVIDDKTKLNDILKEAYNYLGFLLTTMKDYQKAVLCYKNAQFLTDDNNEKSEAAYNLAVTYDLYLKDYKNAEKYFVDSIRITTNKDLVRKYERAAGVFYYNQNKFNKAIEYLKKHNDIESKYMFAYSNYKEGNFEQAEQVFKNLISISKEPVILNASQKNLGNIYYYRYMTKNPPIRKDLDEAVKYFNNAIKINENDDISYFNCGLCYYSIKDYNKAINYFKSASEINPTASKYFGSLGNCYYEKNLYKLAETAYTRAIELDGSNIEAHYNLTKIKEKGNE